MKETTTVNPTWEWKSTQGHPWVFNELRENPRLGGGLQLARKQKCIQIQRNSSMFVIQCSFSTVKNMGSTDSFVDGGN